MKSIDCKLITSIYNFHWWLVTHIELHLPPIYLLMLISFHLILLQAAEEAKKKVKGTLIDKWTGQGCEQLNDEQKRREQIHSLNID